MDQQTPIHAVKKIIKAYARQLSKQISIEHIFLFGSAARGDMTTNSDIDIIVISKKFSKINFLKRLELLSKARRGVAEMIPMDIIGYTPREFAAMDQMDSPQLKKIKREGYFIQ